MTKCGQRPKYEYKPFPVESTERKSKEKRKIQENKNSDFVCDKVFKDTKNQIFCIFKQWTMDKPKTESC